MAAPEFVIADAPFKSYPGGVIALRASDWLGSARGTLSTEIDPRSITGTVVRDTQKVSTSIYDTDRFSFEPSAYQEADDTLTIDMNDVPIEINNMLYRVLVSFLIEGNWDSTNLDTLRQSSQGFFAYSCRMGLHGDAFLTDTNPISISHYMCRGLDSYRIAGFGNVVRWTTPTVLHIKAYGQGGTSIEWLIDQIILLPHLFGVNEVDGWKGDDFRFVGGAQGSFSGAYSLEAGQGLPDWVGSWVDGADGGDANGKFTWSPAIRNEQTGFASDGGGDYQKDDSEYMARVVNDPTDDGEFGDFYYLANSTNLEIQNPPSHCYGLHGPIYIPSQTFVVEDWDRNTGGNHDYQDPDTTPTPTFEDHEWGRTPEGFYWRGFNTSGPFYDVSVLHNHGGALYCNAAGQGVIANRYGQDGQPTGAALQVTGLTDGGAGISAENIRIRGSFFIENMEPSLPDSTPFGEQPLTISTGADIFEVTSNAVRIGFEMRTGQWILSATNVSFFGPETPLHGPVDVSSWWNYGVEVGFRLEVHRYIVKVKLWELSAGEPGLWDFEGERPLRTPSTIYEDYDYDNNLRFSIEEGFDRHTICIYQGGVNHRFSGSYAVYFNPDLEITYDPEGPNESVHALMERPEGNEVGRIEIPAGAMQLVYWGKRAWSEWSDNHIGNYLDFSSKVWNDPGAAELQRSEAVWWWFRSVHGRIPTVVRYR